MFVLLFLFGFLLFGFLLFSFYSLIFDSNALSAL